MKPSPKRVVARWLQTASDVDGKVVDFVSGQEPDGSDGTFATNVSVEFTIKGRLLAQMLRKQARVVGRALEQLDQRQAIRLLDKVERPIMQALRPRVSAWVNDYTTDELGAEASVDLLEFDWESDSYWSAKIDPRSESIHYTVELSVTGDLEEW